MNKKIIAIFSGALLLVGSVAPVFAGGEPTGTSITISGNGSDTTNVSNVTVNQTTQVTQSNSANIDNDIHSTSNSGGNDANYNNGNVTVDTGNAKNQVSVVNTANSNVANVDNCNCGAGDVTVTVSGNNDKSKNTANTTITNQTQVAQANTANVDNDVDAHSNSGDNDANHNVGGSVKVSTGNATTSVALSTMANQNLAQVGSGTGTGTGATLLITGNGSDSVNTINLGLTDWVTLGQANDAHVRNNVDANASTGYNDANYNNGGTSMLGGNVSVDTGDAWTSVMADTAVNFNAANVGCDCLMGVTAKIAGNVASDHYGTTSNVINATLTNGQVFGQANGGRGIDNRLDENSKSGSNDANFNNGGTYDPSIMTGSSTSMTDVTNTGNANVIGDSNFDPFPWWNGNSNVSLTFSLQDLLLALGLNH